MSGQAAPVQLSFLPPPLEKATYSLGVFDAKSGKLVRRLQEAALERDFTVGLNGLITTWDGKDDNGKAVLPGRYAARGYAVGGLKITGEDIAGNDWTSEDETLRIKHVESIVIEPESDDLVAAATLADGKAVLLRYASKDGALVWKQELPPAPASAYNGYVATGSKPFCALRNVKRGVEVRQGWTHISVHRLSDGAKLEAWVDDSVMLVAPGTHPVEEGTELFGAISEGKDGTVWMIGNEGLYQIPRPSDPTDTALSLMTGKSDEKVSGQALRFLTVKPGEPHLTGVAASTIRDRLYITEQTKSGWQRVRGLSWLEAKEENGKPVSTWQTFFERNIRPPEAVTATAVETTLVENSLVPGKPQKVRLNAAFDAKGSYLTTEDGLRLRRISERTNLQSARAAKGKAPGTLAFFQYDGAATDEFSIAGVRNMMEFDAGEFEMTPTGEKPADPKPAEPPPDL